MRRASATEAQQRRSSLGARASRPHPGARRPSAGVGEASRRPAGSAPEAGRILNVAGASLLRWKTTGPRPGQGCPGYAQELACLTSRPEEPAISTRGMCRSSRRPAGSAPEAGRISSSGIGMVTGCCNRRTPVETQRASATEAQQRRSSLGARASRPLRRARRPAAGIGETSRRPAGSAPEAGRISSSGTGMVTGCGNRRTPVETRRASATEARQRRSSPGSAGVSPAS
jgi:hypothetical protein